MTRYTAVVISKDASQSGLVVVDRTSAREAAGAAVEIATSLACERAKREGKRTPAAWKVVAVLGVGAVDALAGVEGHLGTLHIDPWKGA